MHYPISRFTILPLLRRFISAVEGEENLPARGPFIIVANHIFQTDPLFIVSTLFKKHKSKVHYLSVRGDYGQFYERYIARKWAGLILIDPENPSSSLDHAHDHVKKGRLVEIFPEGRRHPEAKVLAKGKTGAVRLALRVGGLCLEIYSIAINNIIFIVLQAVFTLAAGYDLIKYYRNK